MGVKKGSEIAFNLAVLSALSCLYGSVIELRKGYSFQDDSTDRD